MNQNPVLELRATAGLTRAAMAMRLRINYYLLSQAELGYPEHLPPKVLKALAAAGYDPVAIQAQYIAWREAGGGHVAAPAAAIA